MIRKTTFFIMSFVLVLGFPYMANAYEVDADTLALYRCDDYNSNAELWDSTENYNGTFKAAGHPSYNLTDMKLGVAALNFTSGDYIQQPTLLDTSEAEGTMEFWFKPAAKLTAASAGNQWLLSKYNEVAGTGKTTNLAFYKDGSYRDGRICFRVSNGTNSYYACSVTNEWDPVWHHVAGTWGSRGMELWINGTLENSSVFTGHMGNGVAKDFQIGRYWNNAFYFSGQMDEIRVSDVQRKFGNITITSPVNGTSFSLPNIWLNLTTTHISDISYSVDGGANISIANESTSVNASVLWLADGYRSITVYAYNTSLSSETFYFWINGTSEARFISSVDGSVVNNITMVISNFTTTLTRSTNNGKILFPFNLLPLGDITIDINASAAGYRDCSESTTQNFFSVFNRSFSVFPYGFYNITLWDEMKKAPLNENLSATGIDKIMLKVFCTNEEHEYNVSNYTSELHNISISCPVTEICAKVYYSDTNNVPFRCLIPEFASGEIKFWLWENYTTHNTYLQMFKISDLVGTYKGGRLYVLKLINATKQTIHQADFAADGSVNVFVVDGERYELQIISEDGATQKNMPSFYAYCSLSSLVYTLEATELIYNPPISLLYKDTGWSFNIDQATQMISFVFKDSLNVTDSITFEVKNATNMSQVLYTSTETMRRKQYDFSFLAPDINGTYFVSFNAVHGRYGAFGKGQLMVFAAKRVFLTGIAEVWYPAIALFLMIFTAALFGAKFAGIGGLFVALEGALFVYWGWFTVSGTEIIAAIVIVLSVALSIISILKERERR